MSVHTAIESNIYHLKDMIAVLDMLGIVWEHTEVGYEGLLGFFMPNAHAGLYVFMNGKREFSASDIAKALASTVPLIDTMTDLIEKIRIKARECAAAASSGNAEVETLAQVVVASEEEQSDDNKLRPTYGGRRQFDL